jgi:SLT domain-containing protein
VVAQGESLTDPLMAEAVRALARGHNLFAGSLTNAPRVGMRINESADGTLLHTADTDSAMEQIVATARADHARAHHATRRVLDAARADAASAVDTPLGRREATTRMVARLRAQRRHIVTSRANAGRSALRLRRLRYLQHGKAGHGSGRAEIRKAIRKALDIKGIHDPIARARWERGMDLVARRESGYNAHAINRWDSNAAKGTPSIGAWQFIGPTFAAYHQPGTSPNIHNLVAQACAFINYARGRYGVAADASDLAVRIQQADPCRSPRGY